jgi:TolB protein
MGTSLWRVGADGTSLRRLTRPPPAQSWVRDLRGAWSPDGARIAFASNRHAASVHDAGDLDIYELVIASGAVTRLTRDPALADDPCYSPDGKRIYFTSTREAPRDWAVELYAMPAGGGEQRRLTRDAGRRCSSTTGSTSPWRACAIRSVLPPSPRRSRSYRSC